jgi:hypothetical protein
MRKTETFEIAGSKYTITQLGATQGSKLYHELIKALGPTIRSKLENYKELLDLEGKDETASSVAVMSLFLEVYESLPLDLVSRLQFVFSETTKVQMGEIWMELSTGDIFDQHFAGKYESMMMWLFTALKFNFAGFLGSKAKGGASG